ncbi:carbamoyl-phosphate synthase small subunit [Lentibacillus halodurans]|uniref:Carbamoyl phosphate synthase small chain n=1 Tax=Lentibacillus halodurans TaxID=237679 RepID=A0A1I0WQ93_9BACI|nr:carbamoyl phosphate synthase small subunit [Lentibacillus halodurans]SFA90587.1 carbamoyl-phosphate synthase small subunit [Lentibacillus halodurans]
MKEKTGYLLLSTGDVLEGKWLGSEQATEGELVFNTSMTGYQEVMTDPSYAGQIITMTYPLIGNYGFNHVDNESIKPFLNGLVIAHPSHHPDHYQLRDTLEEMAIKHGIPVLYDIDTRAVTRIIRKNGEVYGKITSDKQDFPTKLAVARDIVNNVSVQRITPLKANSNYAGSSNCHVVLWDFGYKQSITRTLKSLGCDVTVVPYDTPSGTIKELHPDAVILSNGPGDPESLSHLAGNIKTIAECYPVLGICLGHQLIASAYGAATKRLPYGHRGSNHPVRNTAQGKVMITSQNHGYVVDDETIDKTIWDISYININDASIEGLKHRQKPVVTVQFHPEAHPGPSDAHTIFEEFFSTILKREAQYA